MQQSNLSYDFKAVVAFLCFCLFAIIALVYIFNVSKPYNTSQIDSKAYHGYLSIKDSSYTLVRFNKLQ